MSAVEWTPERIKILIALWEEGLPTSEIGRRLGVTKNAVVGKVHRLGLKKRQSPIRQTSASTAQPKKPKKVAAPAPAPAAKLPSGDVVRLEELTAAGSEQMRVTVLCDAVRKRERQYEIEHQVTALAYRPGREEEVLDVIMEPDGELAWSQTHESDHRV